MVVGVIMLRNYLRNSDNNDKQGEMKSVGWAERETHVRWGASKYSELWWAGGLSLKRRRGVRGISTRGVGLVQGNRWGLTQIQRGVVLNSEIPLTWDKLQDIHTAAVNGATQTQFHPYFPLYRTHRQNHGHMCTLSLIFHILWLGLHGCWEKILPRQWQWFMFLCC